MAGKCDEAVYLALAAIVAEFTFRLHEGDGTLAHGFLKDASFADFKNHVYVLFFVFSVCSTVFYVRGLQSPRLPLWLAPYIPYLYMFDSAAAVGLGISLHYEHRVGTVVSMVVLTNFFMLHILHSIFSAKKAHHLHDELLATIKAYIHHAANFFFIDLAHKEVLAVATVWRAISMTGHTAQALKVPPSRCPRHDPRFINRIPMRRSPGRSRSSSCTASTGPSRTSATWSSQASSCSAWRAGTCGKGLASRRWGTWGTFWCARAPCSASGPCTWATGRAGKDSPTASVWASCCKGDTPS
jgi:hypothetical protein